VELGVRIAGAMLVAYLVGAIPWALIIGKRLYGVDPREHGSGNLGATNVFRVLGARASIITLLLDAAKGALAVVIASLLVPEAQFGFLAHEWTRVGAMMAAVFGHSYSPYIGFKGGKGVATSAGALAVLTPLVFVLELTIFALVVVLSRMVSLGSIVVAVLYPLLVWYVYPDNLPLQITVIILAVLVLWRHRSNMARIVRGQESKITIRGRGSALRRSKKGED